MSNKSISFLLSIFLFSTVFAKDEFYCYRDGDWELCKTCSKAYESCTVVEDGCKCANIRHFGDDIQGGVEGGPRDCQDENKGWCYATAADCSEDYDYPAIDELNFDNTIVKKSFEACKNPNQDNTGNEEVLMGIRITSNHLLSKDKRNVTLPNNFPYTVEDSFSKEEQFKRCKAECESENTDGAMVCSAWSFDKGNAICHLHHVEACCGQRDKQVSDGRFISGYICPHCWSTYKNCPCSLLKLIGADDTEHASASGRPRQSKRASSTCPNIIIVYSLERPF